MLLYVHRAKKWLTVPIDISILTDSRIFMVSQFNCALEHAREPKLEDTPICMQGGSKSLNRKCRNICSVPDHEVLTVTGCYALPQPQVTRGARRGER
jgi:hypothetical protein